MSDIAPETHAPTVTETATAAVEVARGFRLRTLARRAREVKLSGNALVGVGVGLTALASAVLLWTGIITGAPRAVFLVVAAGLLSVRLTAVRLGAMTPADGIDAPAPRNGILRWLTPIESAVLLIAAGLHPFGSGSDIGPLFGLLAAALLIVAFIRRRAGHAVSEPAKPHASTLLAFTCIAAVFEPLWGWRGQVMIGGLCLISAVLLVQVVLAPRRAA